MNPAGWSTLAVAGRPVLIHEPRTAPRSGVLFLLDESTPPFAADRFREFVESSPYLWFFAFPQKSWWCDTIYSPFDPEVAPVEFLKDQLLPELGKRLERPTSVALAGIGCGGQAALKWAIREPSRFPAVAALDAAIDLFEIYGHGSTLDAIYPTRESLRQQSAYLDLVGYPFPDALWMAVSPDSPWHRGNDRLHEKLNVLGALHRYELYGGDPAEPAWYSPAMLESLAQFLAANLNRPPRRRLL